MADVIIYVCVRRDGHLYWSDVDKMEVWRSNFDGSGAVKILDTGSSPASEY